MEEDVAQSGISPPMHTQLQKAHLCTLPVPTAACIDSAMAGSGQENGSLFRVDRVRGEGSSRGHSGDLSRNFLSQVENSSSWSRGSRTLSVTSPYNHQGEQMGWSGAAPGLPGAQKAEGLSLHRASPLLPPMLRNQNHFLTGTKKCYSHLVFPYLNCI